MERMAQIRMEGCERVRVIKLPPLDPHNIKTKNLTGIVDGVRFKIETQFGEFATGKRVLSFDGRGVAFVGCGYGAKVWQRYRRDERVMELVEMLERGESVEILEERCYRCNGEEKEGCERYYVGESCRE